MDYQKLAIALWVLALVTVVALVEANPAPTELQRGVTSTFDPSNYALQSTYASAGNITALVLAGIAQTRAWQGFYGNITGSITLDDQDNFTFYNWTNAEPQGQIYATLNTSIVWDGVVCYNLTNSSGDYYKTMEDYYGIEPDDVDGVNETFNDTSHPEFTIGAHNVSGCPTTYIFQSDQPQYQNFVNVLLYDPTLPGTGWIYGTIIENKTSTTSYPGDLLCYNGQECDFQILVNENGHKADTATTTYFFWVELT